METDKAVRKQHYSKHHLTKNVTWHCNKMWKLSSGSWWQKIINKERTEVKRSQSGGRRDAEWLSRGELHMPSIWPWPCTLCFWSRSSYKHWPQAILAQSASFLLIPFQQTRLGLHDLSDAVKDFLHLSICVYVALSAQFGVESLLLAVCSCHDDLKAPQRARGHCEHKVIFIGELPSNLSLQFPDLGLVPSGTTVVDVNFHRHDDCFTAT